MSQLSAVVKRIYIAYIQVGVEQHSLISSDSDHTVFPRINVHALMFENALSFRNQVHALIFEHKNYYKKNTCTYIRPWKDLDNKQMINIFA